MFAILKVMVLGLVRDRGALAMAFVLPPIIFLIFASVFAGAGGGEDLRIKVAIRDSAAKPETRAVVERLGKVPAIRAIAAATAADVEYAVRRGEVDAGLIIRTTRGRTGFVIVEDPSKKVAASLLTSHLRAALQGRRPAGPVASPITTKPVIAADQGDGTIAYYAGAVAILFLLFAAVQNAVTLQEDRESGILDRLVVGRGGIGALISGKFTFIVLLGVLQVGVIFAIAWLFYGVALPDKFLLWAVTTLAAAICAAGMCLLLVTLCSSRRQAQTLGNFLVLIISAMGGSMIPRFLMPEWLQSAGWMTPNAWALDAYTETFWRGGGASDLFTAWIVLTLAGLAALAAARVLGRRFERI